ncbi:inhibitory POU protein [Condylostylus longicornis]|uniref:inhibitory POU protein n=1 Tax=Condylostylus longicornis TaxID=2530218 RepID=UPI00244DFC21|nr:inhibitory POU protein [Condylostylus longicornis]
MANNGNYSSRRLFIRDFNNDVLFLVNTGADVSVIPNRGNIGCKNRPSDFLLSAANGAPTQTYGSKLFQLNIGLRRQFSHAFIIASVGRSIIDADFLERFGLLVDLSNRRLVDPTTNMSVEVSQAKVDVVAPVHYVVESKFGEILKNYSTLTQDSDYSTPVRHSVVHHIVTKGQFPFFSPRRLDSVHHKTAKTELEYMMHPAIDGLEMLDHTGQMTTLTPLSESPLTPHHQIHSSYHGVNHMIGHHHSGALTGHSPANHHPHSGQHHSVVAAAVAVASLHPDNDTDPRELEAFAERFKQRRIKLGVTQADVGKALANLKLPGVGALSQSTICRFESLTLSHNNMIALKPILQAWLEEAEAQARNKRRDPDAPSVLPAGEKKRKRTSIAAPEKRSLEAYFAVQPRPSGEKIAAIAEKLDLKKNVV